MNLAEALLARPRYSVTTQALLNIPQWQHTLRCNPRIKVAAFSWLFFARCAQSIVLR